MMMIDDDYDYCIRIPPEPEPRETPPHIALPWSAFLALYPVCEAVGYGEIQRDTAGCS